MYGLSNKDLLTMRNVFKKFPAIEHVKLFGSRAKGTFNPNSDIDIVAYGDISFEIMSLIKFYLEESDLPYEVDVQAYTLIQHKHLLEHINRVGEFIYKKAG